MPATTYVGHVSLTSLVPGDGEDLRAAAAAAALALTTQLSITDFCFVYEEGSVEGKPHLHFWWTVSRAKQTVISALKRLFVSPGGPPPSTGFYSLKLSDPSKEAKYFLYLAKGVNGKHGDPVYPVFESAPRLWAPLHEEFHRVAAEIADRGKKGPEAWYATLAATCRATGAVSREAVLDKVVHYYVHESKKGFEVFAVMRTFWRVFSLVDGATAAADMRQSAYDRLFRV